MARRVFAFIGLGLDDGATDTGEEEPTADEIAGDVVDRARKEVDAQAVGAQDAPAASRTAASAARASSICAASGSEPVPPAIRFDSSQLPRRSTS